MADNPYERDDRTARPSAPSPDATSTTPEPDGAGAHGDAGHSAGAPDDARHDVGSPDTATTELPAVAPGPDERAEDGARTQPVVAGGATGIRRDAPVPEDPAEDTDDARDAGGATGAPASGESAGPASGAGVVPPGPATSGQDEGTPGRTASADDAVTSTFDLRDRPGQHEAERPVPRSGLVEHRSAGYLTGELGPREPDAAPAPAADLPSRDDEPPGAGPSPDHGPENTDAGPDTAVILEGATTTTKLPSRAGAHVWTVLLTLLLTPVAWYLLADAGARLTGPAGNPWDTGQLNVAALLELAGGLLVLAVVLLLARWSSLGAIVTGSLVLIVGVPFLAVPQWTQNLLEPVADWLATLGDFGDNVASHLVASGSSGRLVVYGLALILVGAVAHGARRRGRREVRDVLTA